MPDDDDARVPAVDDGCEDPVELRRRLEALRLENAVMRETINVLKAGDPRLDPSGLTSREKARVVDAVRGEFGLADALSAVGLRRSTYYYGRTAMRAVDKYAVLRERVRLLFEEGGRVWGYRTITPCCGGTRRIRWSSRRRSCAASCGRRGSGPYT